MPLLNVRKASYRDRETNKTEIRPAMKRIKLDDIYPGIYICIYVLSVFLEALRVNEIHRAEREGPPVDIQTKR